MAASSSGDLEPGSLPDPVHHTILQTVASIGTAADLDEVIAVTRRAARTLTGADGVTFVLRAGQACYYVDEEAIAPLWKGQRFPIDRCISGWVMRHREPAVIPDIYLDDRIPHEAYRPTFVKSLVMVPVRKADPIAAIGAYWSAAHVATLQHTRLIELLADAAGTRLCSGQLWARLRETIAQV